MYRSAVLFGRDHTELGKLAVIEITPRLAIGISRGRFPKGYAHVDPNEDAVFAATDGETTVLAVADGHNGVDASHQTIEAIASTASETINSPGGLLDRLVRAAVESFTDLGDERCRTALTVCVLDHTGVSAVTFGDTGVIVAGRRHSRVYQGSSPFLGQQTGKPERLDLEQENSIALGVATDGVFGFMPKSVQGHHQPARAEIAQEYVERVIDLAFKGGAGDNIAVAAHRFTGD